MEPIAPGIAGAPAVERVAEQRRRRRMREPTVGNTRSRRRRSAPPPETHDARRPQCGGRVVVQVERNGRHWPSACSERFRLPATPPARPPGAAERGGGGVGGPPPASSRSWNGQSGGRRSPGDAGRPARGSCVAVGLVDPRAWRRPRLRTDGIGVGRPQACAECRPEKSIGAEVRRCAGRSWRPKKKTPPGERHRDRGRPNLAALRARRGA